MTDLLKLKFEMKRKKPVVRRVEKHRKQRLPDNWRKPKGHHSKIRRKERHELKMPLIGRSTPNKLKHTDRKGRKIIIISRVEDLKLLKSDSVGVVSSKLGLKKKSLIAMQAKGKNYAFVNFNIEQVLSRAEEVKKKKAEKKLKTEKVEKPKEKPVKPSKKPTKPVQAEKPGKKREKPVKSEEKKVKKPTKPKKEANKK